MYKMFYKLSLIFYIFNFLYLINGTPISNVENNYDSNNKQEKVNINEIMSKIGSMSVLACDPVFGSSISKKQATWYKNGIPIADVTGERNAIYMNRSLNGFNKNIPDVGFLVIPHITKEDEGEYWCIRNDNQQIGEISRIKIAYINDINPEDTLIASTENPYIGQFVEIRCLFVDAYPTPAVTWNFNHQPLPMNSNYEIASNGSLLIYHFTEQNSGIYECILQNFAGKTKALIYLPYPEGNIQNSIVKMNHFSSFITLKNSILWFFIGCLTTFCLLLIYLLTLMICYRQHNRRPISGELPIWKRLLKADPALAPGFRKVIAPMNNSSQPPLISENVYP